MSTGASSRIVSAPKMTAVRSFSNTRTALAASLFLIFSILLLIRPLLEAALLSHYRPINDPNQHAAFFMLKDSYVGQDFLDGGWQWETFDDPTHGRVDYVDKQTATASNLSYATDSKFVMRADDFNTVGQNERGRRSVRISSYNAYDESIIVLDLQHMPEGCSTWPAFWTLSQTGPWPRGGEIDIIEGVNNQQGNLASLHTTPSCTMPDDRSESGTPTSSDCDTSVNFNQGCGVSFQKSSSYGSNFNSQGGGFYVMARTRQDGIRIWYWSRNDPTTPPEIRNGQLSASDSGSDSLQLFGDGGISPNPGWGMPAASFPVGDNCDYDSHFDAHVMVFDLTFCGDWAGAVYPDSGCPGDCVAYVNDKPWAFSNAYWEVNSLRVYTPTY